MLAALLLASVTVLGTPIPSPSVPSISDADVAHLIGAMYTLAETKPAYLTTCVQHENVRSTPPGTSMQDLGFHDQDAMLLCAAASGEAGTRWKTLYDSTTNKGVLAKMIDDAIQASSKHESDKAHADITWMHATLRPGISRTNAYQLLKARGLIAYNDDYNPGDALPDRAAPSPDGTRYLGGCNFEMTRSQSYWPRFKQPLPPRKGACALDHRTYVSNPDATVDLPSGSNIACGAMIYVTLKFDLHDQLSGISESKEAWTCI